MLRRYETIFIVRSDLQSDEMNSLIDRYAGIIVSLDGKTIKVENWGKRRLAYPIEKMQDGVYVRIDFVARHKVVVEIERNFKINDNVLRFQTVKLSDKVDLEEIEREIADVLKKEEERKKEEQRKEEQRKEEVISEPVVSEAVAEEPDSKEVKTDDKGVVQETSSVETDEK
ncbi:MAG: 30S ribosomal protein S6, partial [Thermodesulfobacteriota bacterium]|nr:30S ribosomal protein S6 [Thermodesulfobacteriota bacterium]